MQEAAVQLLNSATVSSPADCRRRIQTGPMTAKADQPPVDSVRRVAGVS
jgi:hypothetical protein